RRAAPDPTGVLRGARARAARVLAAADRQARPHGARTGSARLRNVDGGEARTRPRVDCRPLGAPLSAHGRRDRLARAQAIAAGTRIRRRVIAVVLVLAAGGVAAWLVLRPAAAPRLIVGVDDDTLKWTANPLGVVRWQRALGAQAVRVWVPWHGETKPSGPIPTELARMEQAARKTTVVLAVFGFARNTPQSAPSQARFCAYAR